MRYKLAVRWNHACARRSRRQRTQRLIATDVTHNAYLSYTNIAESTRIYPNALSWKCGICSGLRAVIKVKSIYYRTQSLTQFTINKLWPDHNHLHGNSMPKFAFGANIDSTKFINQEFLISSPESGFVKREQTNRFALFYMKQNIASQWWVCCGYKSTLPFRHYRGDGNIIM